MRLKVVPGDFVVEEQANLALIEAGPWAVYRVRKVNLTTLDVQTRLASMCRLARRQVVFPALKDKEAIAIQYAALPAGLPATLTGERFEAQRIGYRCKPLTASDLRGNAFALTPRDLGHDEAALLRVRLAELGQRGLPNYFDAQRFGSLTAEGSYLGHAILRRDAETALRAYLTVPFVGDPPPVRAFKRQAATLWPDWTALFQVAPRPSNYRSVLTFLVGHPQDYRKALNLIPQRLLALYLSAYQSALWNRIAGAFLDQAGAAQGAECAHLPIANTTLPVPLHLDDPSIARLAAVQLALPNHRAVFQPPEVATIALRVLAEEGLALDDLKARLLQKAYLTKGSRALWLLPQDMATDEPATDERFPGRLKLGVRFTLPRGSYATLVLKIAALPVWARPDLPV